MIINKWIFYWINFIDNINFTISNIFIICFLIFISLLFNFVASDKKDNIIGKYLHAIKIVIIVTAVLAVINITLPSKETMYQMVIAENVTYENVDKGVKGVKDTVDYIFEKVDKHGGK